MCNHCLAHREFLDALDDLMGKLKEDIGRESMPNVDLFKDVSTERLQAELKRREEAEKQAQKPQQLKEVDLTGLRRVCQEYIDSLANDGWVDDDLSYYIYEEAMQAIFGEDVFEWIDKQLDVG